MISVLYDYQILLRQKYGGISRYFYEVISRSSKKIDMKVIAIKSQNYYFRLHCKEYAYSSNFKKYIFRVLNAIYTRLYIMLNAKNIDVIHPTYYVNYGKCFRWKNIKNVITVHDMIHEIYWGDDKSLGKKFIIRNKRKSILTADHIVVVSKKTKEDLLKYYPCLKKENISVIYHGSSNYEDIEYIDLHSKFGKYILFVGNRADYKNFNLFIEAMRTVHTLHPDVTIICVGGGKISDYEERYLTECGLKDIVIQVNATDAELVNLYRNALFFVFPSSYEGFGIPILEAFACECPVLLSECSCFPEIGGNAVDYFDVKNINDFKEKIMFLIENKEHRNYLRDRGKQRGKLFSWEIAAERTIDVYKKVLGEET